MPKRKPGTGRMFAVVNDLEHTPVFVKQGSVGFWPCKSDDHVAWAHMHVAQGAVVTEAALRGSMVGWDNPAARPAVRWHGPCPPEVAQEGGSPAESSHGTLHVRPPRSDLHDSPPSASKINKSGDEFYHRGDRFYYHFEPIDWFDARTGHKRVGPGCGCTVIGSPKGYGNVWRNGAGEMVGRMNTKGYRRAFKIVSGCGGVVSDLEIDEVYNDLMSFMALWIRQGADDWPVI